MMDDFNERIDACGLVELRCHGNSMSWCNGQEGTTRRWARLDRALANVSFSTRFDSASLEYFQWKSSNHGSMVI